MKFYLTLHSIGNVYIADQHNNRIRKVTTDGIISTVAGTGFGGNSGDGGDATNADLCLPSGVAIDLSGMSIYFILLFIYHLNARYRQYLH